MTNTQPDKQRVVNFYGGPGSGKSTTAAGLFHALKQIGMNVELTHEYAKELAWEGHDPADQIHIFGEQQRRMFRLRGKVDLIISDSPILLSSIYGEDQPECFHELVNHVHRTYDNFNVFLGRDKPYNPAGRFQTESEAREIDERILNNVLFHLNIHSSIQPKLTPVLYTLMGHGWLTDQQYYLARSIIQ